MTAALVLVAEPVEDSWCLDCWRSADSYTELEAELEFEFDCSSAADIRWRMGSGFARLLDW